MSDTPSVSEPAATTTLVEPVEDAAPPKSRRKLLIVLISIVLLILLLVGAAFLWYAVTKKPLTQLPMLSSATPPHYVATMYDVQQPIGVAVDEPNNRVYVTQSEGDRVVAVFDMSGNKLDPLKPPGDPKAFHIPVYVAVDPTTSNVYVSDRATSSVYVYDANGAFIKEFKPTGVKAWQPLALSFDTTGNLFVTDVLAPTQKVLKITPDGTVAQTFGEKDGLAFPNGVVAAPDGTVYVTDSNHSRALAYKADGTLVGSFARGSSDSPLGLPRGITIDDRGRIYVVDTTNQDFQVFTPGDTPTDVPTYSFSAGEEGTAEGSFEYPNGIAVDSRSRLYITDRENNRVQVWSY